MSEFWKATLWRVAYTMGEAIVGVISAFVAGETMSWQTAVLIVVVAGGTTLIRCLKMTLPEVMPADETTDDEVDDTPAEEYDDDLEAEGDDDELE